MLKPIEDMMEQCTYLSFEDAECIYRFVERKITDEYCCPEIMSVSDGIGISACVLHAPSYTIGFRLFQSLSIYSGIRPDLRNSYAQSDFTYNPRDMVHPLDIVDVILEFDEILNNTRQEMLSHREEMSECRALVYGEGW